MDHGGWYDKADPRWAFRKSIDMQFIAAQGPPGGGAAKITQRYARHFGLSTMFHLMQLLSLDI